MQFYFDESGDFSVPTSREQHSVGIVVGVDIPELVSAHLDEQFGRFVQNLTAGEQQNGEPKGRLLSDDSLRTFANMLAEFDDVYITATLLDLTSLCGGRDQAAKDSVVRKLTECAGACIYDSLREQTLELAKQVSNLSAPQILRIFAWAVCLRGTLSHCVTFRCDARFDEAWSALAFHVDPVQHRKGSREQLVFEKMLPAWLTAMSRNDPYILIEEKHSLDHPFVKRYETDKGIDIGALIRENIKWPSSATSIGLQIADISAMIIRKAAGNRGIIDFETLKTYGRLMTRSPLAPHRAVGCTLLGDISPTEIGDRYAGLMEAIAEARK